MVDFFFFNFVENENSFKVIFHGWSNISFLNFRSNLKVRANGQIRAKIGKTFSCAMIDYFQCHFLYFKSFNWRLPNSVLFYARNVANFWQIMVIYHFMYFIILFSVMHIVYIKRYAKYMQKFSLRKYEYIQS